MTSDPKLTAQQAAVAARIVAIKASAFVRDLRRLLGQAMAEEARANAVAREAEGRAR